MSNPFADLLANLGGGAGDTEIVSLGRCLTTQEVTDWLADHKDVSRALAMAAGTRRYRYMVERPTLRGVIEINADDFTLNAVLFDNRGGARWRPYIGGMATMLGDCDQLLRQLRATLHKYNEAGGAGASPLQGSYDE